MAAIFVLGRIKTLVDFCVVVVLLPFLARSRSNKASTKAAAWAGTIATPRTMLALTMSFPCQVTGLTSPNPTVVTVKKMNQ
jgi:hypothetical protein